MRKQNLFGAIGLVLILGAGCATPMPQADRQSSAPAAVHVQVALTPEQEKEKTDARGEYSICLREAAQYANARASISGDEAALIAPMCYPQFLRFEVASTAGMESRDRRTFDREGDKRQVDFAAEAIRQQQGLAALAPAK